MSFIERFFEVLGIRPRRLEPIVEVGHDPEALAKTQAALPAATVTLEPGQPLVGITTDDLQDWRLRPDYLEARAAREEDRRARAEAAPASIADWNIKPQ